MRTPGLKAAEYFQSLSAKIEKAAIEAETETIKEARRVAILTSSGDETAETLAKAGHPYAKRRPQPEKYPARIINSRKGYFRAAWRAVAPRKSGNQIVSRLENTDPKAAYMQGTDRMVARPIAAEVVTKTKESRRTRLFDAVRKAVKIK